MAAAARDTGPPPEEAVLEAVLATAPDAMLAVDADGRIVAHSRALAAMFGYDEDELRGATVETLIPEALREVHQRHRDGFFVAPRRRSIGVGRVLGAVRRDGTEIPVEISLDAARLAPGRVVCVAAVRNLAEGAAPVDAWIRAERQALVVELGRRALRRRTSRPCSNTRWRRWHASSACPGPRSSRAAPRAARSWCGRRSTVRGRGSAPWSPSTARRPRGRSASAAPSSASTSTYRAGARRSAISAAAWQCR
jgi:PAS domain S-box-containing protein